jgi:hypothetical protein
MFGRILLALSALNQILGLFIAAFNHTHVLNPNWPPHARFHNGQTMPTGICLGLATLWYTFRSTATAEAAKDSLFTAAVFGSLYWVTAISAVAYPGSKAIDPEFGEGFPQFWLFVGTLDVTWLGWWVETRVLGGGGGKRM